MELIKELKLGTVAEIVITVIIVYALTQAIKQTKISNRWMPWIAMVLGIFSALFSVLVTGDHNYLPASVLGLLIGGFTAGLFDGFAAFITHAEKEAEGIISVNHPAQNSNPNPPSNGSNLQGKEIPDDTDQNGGEK